MAQPPLRPPPSLQPRPKAVPTFSGAAVAAKSAPSTPQLSTPSTQSRQSSPARSIVTTDISDKATTALIKRVLCPSSHGAEPRPLNELLPPLTSSNEIDLQLYAIIAIVMKDVVYSWYGKVTPDQTFVEEVVKIMAHCTTQLESRLRKVDLESLLLDEIPELAERHVNAYRISNPNVHPSSLSTDPRKIYHNLNPHPALSPVPDGATPATINELSKIEADYRQLLVQGVLTILLPTEDLENACLRTLVADVIAESVLGNAIGGKASECWFIWSSISKLVEVVQARVHPTATGKAIKEDTRGRLERFGLLSDHEEKQTTGKHRPGSRSTLSSWFWMSLQYIYLAAIGIRFVIVGLFLANSRPIRSSSLPRPREMLAASPIEKASQSSARQHFRPLLHFRVFSLLSTLLDLSSRMPWLAGSLALMRHHLTQGPFTVGATDGIIDQYLHTLVSTHLHPTSLVPHALLLLRQTIFPANTLPPTAPPPSPSPAQAQQIKRSCAEALLSFVPAAVSRQVLGPDDEDAIKDVEGQLDIWSDAYCNKHLLYGITELILVRVFPELGEKGVRELMAERLGGEEGGDAGGGVDDDDGAAGDEKKGGKRKKMDI